MPYEIPTFRELLARAQGDFAAASVPPESVEYVMAGIQARLARGNYNYQSYVFSQAFPDTAEDTNFWHWAAVFGMAQKQATTWRGTVRLTGSDGTAIPAGTELVSPSGVFYETDADGEIDDGIADIQATAVEAGGGVSNLLEDDILTLSSPIIGADTDVEVRSIIRNGAAVETVEQGQARLLQRLRNPPAGGGPGDYERWTLEVPGATRAWAFPGLNGAGTVSVAFVRDGDAVGGDPEDIIPSAPERAEVLAYLLSKAPVTANVSVIELVPAPLDIVLASLTPDTPQVRAAVRAELEDLLFREAEPNSTLLISHIDDAISDAVGETDHELSSPTANITYTPTQMPIMGDIT